MTLFWHGHFATSADKVSAYRMWLQNENYPALHAGELWHPSKGYFL
jgi:hypothetical protein